MDKNQWTLVHNGLLLALVVLLIINFYFTNASITRLSPVEVQKPVVKITTITASCEQCIDAGEVVKAIKQGINADFKETNVSVDEATEIINKYSLKRLPAIIIEGKVIEGLANKNNASIFESPLPYYDISTRTVKGLVNAVIIDPGCLQCTPMDSVIQQLGMAGMYFASATQINATQDSGIALITKYNLKKLPTIILSKEAEEYPIIQQAWSEIGTKESDGMLVLRQIPPLYVEDGKLRGNVAITMIVDSSCAECYNVTLHEKLLENNFGMKFASTEIIDSSSSKAKKIIAKHGIEKLPTYVLDSEASAYPGLHKAWPEVGIIKDGDYVFTAVDKLGTTYKDIKLNQVINASSQ
ncbi:hypothetical protein HY486_01895 [Candidatus Woesearchaeota archaeon]|nr:hypothetical protein [Candidatus Woesearchaeota archaeon]